MKLGLSEGSLGVGPRSVPGEGASWPEPIHNEEMTYSDLMQRRGA